MDRRSTPIVHFYRLIEEARLPQRADRSAGGTLPTRAYRYCEAVTGAAGFGWWIFPPTDLQFLWDGYDIFWQCTGGSDWLPLMPAAQFPDFSSRFDRAAPASLTGCSPPFLTALPEPGTLQIWTGLIARTAADWSLLIKSPVNVPSPGGFSMYEGIVDTDRWFGPLFTNLRFTRTNAPVRLRADFPLAQVQPVPRVAFSESTLSVTHTTADMAGFEERDWTDYGASVATPSGAPGRSFGSYAAVARKRSRGGCPVDAECG